MREEVRMGELRSPWTGQAEACPTKSARRNERGLAGPAPFEVGHALACRRAAARHLRDQLMESQESEVSSVSGRLIVEAEIEERASSGRLDKLKRILRNKRVR
jgi:hypothetical protein